MKRLIYLFKSVLLLLLLFCSSQLYAQELYVRAGATGAGSGADFANAFTSLQQALAAATTGNKIYVARGTYTPTNQFDFDGSGGTDAREVTFQIPNGVEVYGGFAGNETGAITQAVLDARDFVTNISILSGDIGGDDAFSGTTPTFTYGNYGDNAYHVVYTKNATVATRVNGFTIRGGNASGFDANGDGAGWYNDGSGSGNSSNPTLINIAFSQNRATGSGGGMYNIAFDGTSSPTLTNCSFSQNNASSGGGMFNNGLEANGTSSPRLTNCSFSQNTAINNGGGMYNNADVSSFSFNTNGGISNPILINCSFSQNTAANNGGGMYNNAGDESESTSTLTNCSFSQNTATNSGGGMYNIASFGDASSTTTLINSIFWGNTANGSENSWFNQDPATTNVSFSLIQETSLPTGTTTTPANPTPTEENNILGQDPLFVSTTDLRLRTNSPALNTGSNTAITTTGVATDLAGNVRTQGIVDMGAYEGEVAVQTDFYVNAAGNNTTGANFATAFTTLQQALDVATSGSKIYVAKGTYTPTQQYDFTTGNTSTGDARAVSFKIPNGVEVYGGFVGDETGAITPVVLNGRNFVTNTTILSGDIGGNDAFSGTTPPFTYDNYGDNAYHVVYTKNATVATRVNGFTIRGGNADGSGTNNRGGAWYNDGSGTNNISNPTLSNIAFSQNRATGSGGGMYNNAFNGTSSPTLTNCSFSQNSAGGGGGMYNDGIRSSVGVNGVSSPRLTNCSFSQNTATDGGGMYNNGSRSGGGMFNGGSSSPTLINCLFLENTASTGGGIYTNASASSVSSPSLTNCSFSQNRATNSGGGMYNVASFGDGNSTTTLINSIFWGNTANGVENSWFSQDPATTNVSFSLIRETSLPNGTNATGGNNIFNQNPLFVSTTDLRLRATSPAIDAGDDAAIIATGVTTDLAGNVRIQSVKVDMGAYEGEVAVQTDFYVNAAGNNTTGANFATAFTTLQQALDAATSGSKIYVAKGTYKPTQQYDFDTGNTSTGDTRAVSFKIPNGVEVYGGFAGTETGVIDQVVLNARNFVTNTTILSGDIGTVVNNTDNAYHVVFTKNVNSATKISGFTITGGNADGSNVNRIGAGWYNDGSGSGNSSNPTLINIAFSQNTATTRGGGMFNRGTSNGTSSPILINCLFSQNTANAGGGMFNNASDGTSSPTLTNCSFSQNTAANDGGGMFNNAFNGISSPRLTNCSFSQNTAGEFGGGMINFGANGGVSSPILTNCSFSQNNANNGGGGGMFNSGSGGGVSSPILINSIFWGNTAASGRSWFNLEAAPTVSYSLVGEASFPTGTINGGNNIFNQNPLFVSTTDLRLRATSPALNVGSNTAIPAGVATDLAGNDRTQSGTVDMGAYEGEADFYVNAAGNNTTGANFATAFTTLQQALDVATSGSKIYVAKGTYKPTQQYNFDTGNTSTGDTRAVSFKIPNGVEVYGGFAGDETGVIDQAVLDTRNFVTNTTILSGDIGTVVDNTDNAYHVVYTKNATSDTKISGFTITGGNADGSNVNRIGAGWYNDGSGSGNSSNPTLINIAFSQNTAAVHGGGMYNNGFGGISSPTLTNCSFSQNTAANFGGGMFNDGSNGTSSPRLTNCSFSQNTATTRGGGMYTEAWANSNGRPILINSIFWGNTANGAENSWFNDGGNAAPTVSFSLIQETSLPIGTVDGGNNILNGDPLFVSTTDLRLQATSPALNVGDNTAIPAGVTTDLAGNDRTQSGIVDMGAYEGGVAAQTDFYVNAGGDNTTGANFATAFTTLQQALDVATSGSKIYVAKGTYKPTQQYNFDTGNTSTGDTRAVSFKIPNGVEVYGGFAGTETGVIDQAVLDTRNFVTNTTILSGDIGTVVDNTDNAYHVVFTKNVNSATKISGFTIIGGNANVNNSPNDAGGGWFNDGSGSGKSSNPTLINIAFLQNIALYGGGMCNDGLDFGATNPSLTNCSFSQNMATEQGGGIYNYGINSGTASPILTNCSFSQNKAKDGGGMFNRGDGNGTSSPRLTNCSFSQNTATVRGGGMYNVGSSGVGGSKPTLINSIFWGNTAPNGNSWLNGNAAAPTVSYSLVGEASFPTGTVNEGNNIFNRNPLFTNAATGDLSLTLCSPAINVGNNASVTTGISDIAGNIRIQLNRVDMGAYESNVKDTQVPTITAPTNVSVNTSAGLCTGEVSSTMLGTPTGNDNCVTVTFSSNNTLTVFPIGVTIVTWTATDASGNTKEANQTVTVVDTQGPTVSPLPETSYAVNNTAGSNSFTNTGTIPNISVTDCTPSAPTPTPTYAFTGATNGTSNTLTGQVFPIGTTTVGWSVTGANGISSTGTFNIVVTDNEIPTITPLSPDYPVTTTAGTCSFTNGSIPNGAGADNSTTPLTYKYDLTDVTTGTVATLVGQVFNIGTTTVVWRAIDAAGNNSVISTFTVTVTDNQGPTVNPVPAASYPVNNTAGSNSFTNNTGTIPDISVTDCTPGVLTPSYSFGGATTGISNTLIGQVFPIGTTTVDWTVTDALGNTSTGTFTVVVTNFVAPPAPPVVTPSSPTGFTSTTVSPTQINLNWNPVSSNVTGYQVFQNGVLIATLPLGTTSYQITGLSPNTFYLFTIVAINRSNSGIITSGAVSAREWTFPENPTLLGISTLCESGQATVGLSSSANVYRIYDQMSGGNLVVESNNGSFLLPNVSKTTTFYATSFGSGSNKESQSRTAITVTVEPIFEAKIKGDKTRFSCDKSIVLEAELVENALRYTWFRNGVEVGTGPVFEAAFSADYQVRISRGVCSFLSEKVSVQVGFTPIANIAQSNFTRFCDKGTLNAIQTNTNATYKWLLNNVVIGEGTSLSVSQSGTYALQVTQNGCASTAQVEVVVTTGTTQTPVLEISQTAICEGNEVTISVKNPQPNVVYQWLLHGRNFDVIGNSIKVSMVGRYSVRAISLQNSACSSAISNEVEFSTIRTTPIYMRVSEDNKTLFLEDVNFSQADIKSIEWFFEGKSATSLGTTSTITPKEDGYYSAQVINQNGCKVQTRTVHFIVTKIPIITGEEELKIDIFTIYPNPSKGIFNVRFPKALTEAIQISVFDATGKAIQTQVFEKGSQEFSIDLQKLAKGMYLIRFNQANIIYSKSIILE